MKIRRWKILKQVMVGIICLVLIHCPVFLVCANEHEAPSELYAVAAVLMDADSGRILYEKNAQQPYPMASTTKIMTCILALEYGELDKIVTFSEHASSMPDVQMNAKAGEQYYLKDLLYSMMLESHNDSAVAVAENVGGSVEAFAKMMNQKAESIGCTGTHFVTPNGLDGADEEGIHCTTAADLALILRYCIEVSPKAKEFLEITGTPSYEFQELNKKRYISCQNHNALLTSYQGAISGKTGFTGKAGYCYTGAVKKENQTLIVALLGSGWYPNKSFKWKDTRKLMDYGFENFHYVSVGKKEWDLPEVAVTNGMKEKVKIESDGDIFSFLLGREEKITCKIDYKENIQAPVERGSVIGSITYELEGKEIERFQIYAAENVKKATFLNKVKKWIEKIVKFM